MRGEMIDPYELTESDIGRKVVYVSFEKTEEGILTSWNSKYVFVKFRGPDGEACRPETICFIRDTKNS